MTETERAELEAALGYRFTDPRWLERALTHRSRRHELASTGRAGDSDNERLEFLGDAILGLAVSEYLVTTFPEWSEGRLSKSRARLVSARSLHAAAQRLGLGRSLRLGRGEEKSGGREKQTLLADAYEAVVAAIYSDGGSEAATRFVRRSLLDPAVREQPEVLGQPDHKSALQEYVQGRGWSLAQYRVVRESGPDHHKTFVVEVQVGGRVLASSEGTTKKDAEQAAARLALEQLVGKA